MIKIIIIVVAIAAVLCIGIFACLQISSGTEMLKKEGDFGTKKERVGEINENYVENQVLCKAKTKEQAEKIAEKIGGTLIGYFEGIGMIAIEETVAELMQRLEDEGLDYLEVYPNLQYSTNQIGDFKIIEK